MCHENNQISILVDIVNWKDTWKMSPLFVTVTGFLQRAFRGQAQPCSDKDLREVTWFPSTCVCSLCINPHRQDGNASAGPPHIGPHTHTLPTPQAH